MTGVMARNAIRRRAADRSIPRRSPTIRPACIWCRAILLALLQREKTGVGQQVAVSLYDSMLAMQMQEAAMWLMREPRVQLGRHAADRRVRDHRRRARDGRRLQGQPAARHLRGARPARPVAPIRASTTFAKQVRDTRPSCSDCSASSFATDTHRALARPAGGAGPALRAGADAWARRSLDEQTAVNGMVVSTQRTDARCAGRLAGAPWSAGGFALRHAPPPLGAHGAAVLAELGYSPRRIAGCARTGWSHERPLRRRGPRRARHDRPAGAC